MRAGLSTILQTLTPEAAGVLNQSIGEAARRSHGQTTPLHVAATLLAAPAGILRQACVRSHPNTSHPLQCRALELCFSVALDRLPSLGGGVNSGPAGGAAEQPPISNALMAALKRAQANQRRGCPEQQQQPLLAIKVELEQLIISILDDPSVSRVMREARFSSPAVKASIEQTTAASAATTTTTTAAAAATTTTTAAATTTTTTTASTTPASNSSFPPGGLLAGLGFRPSPAAPGIPLLPANRNLYVNPRLQQQAAKSAAPSPAVAAAAAAAAAGEEREEIKKAFDVLLRRRKRNPILVGDSQPEAVLKELLQRIQKKGIGHGLFPQNVEIIPVEKRLAAGGSQIPSMLQELSDSIDRRLNEAGGATVGVVLDLGDLQWLVEKVGGGVNVAVVSEMKKLLARFSEGGGGRVWLVGSATCATYLRCQVYHPNMELDWDLQALPIAARSPLASFPGRSGSNGISGGSAGSPAFLPISNGNGGSPPARRPSEKPETPWSEMCPVCKDSYEHELAKLVAMEFEKSSDSQKPLPPWLQLAKLSSGDAGTPTAIQSQTKEQELLWKKTTEELLKRWSETCHRLHPNNSHPPAKLQPAPASNPVGPRPGSPVGTELVLGCTKKSPPTPAKIAADHREKVAGGAAVDYDSFKRLFKGLTEKVSWQQEAASAVATTVMHCKSGGARGDTWLLFMGPDRMGKKKMAAALSELVFSGDPVTVSFASPKPDDVSFRGRTAMDRVFDAVRRNPFSVVVLDSVDTADMLVLGSLRRAMERGRLPDSHGREVSLGSAIFVLISGESTAAASGEEKLLAAANSGWQLELAALEKPGKRRAEWSPEQSWPAKPPRLSLDLNLAAGSDEETTEGSLNSSDLTVEQDAVDCNGKLAVAATGNNSNSSHNDKRQQLLAGGSSSSAWEMLRSAVDAAVSFKPVDFGEVRRKVSETMTRKFRAAAGESRSLLIDEEAMDRLVGGLWFGSTTAAAFEEWTETVMVPCFRQLRGHSAVRLLPAKEGYNRRDAGTAAAGGLPTRVRVAADGPCGVP